jgi:hypothetical protein
MGAGTEAFECFTTLRFGAISVWCLLKTPARAVTPNVITATATTIPVPARAVCVAARLRIIP